MSASLGSLPAFSALYQDLKVTYGSHYDPVSKYHLRFYQCKHSASVPTSIHLRHNWGYLVDFSKFASRQIHSLTTDPNNPMHGAPPGVVTLLVVGQCIWLSTSTKGPRGQVLQFLDESVQDAVIDLTIVSIATL